MSIIPPPWTYGKEHNRHKKLDLRTWTIFHEDEDFKSTIGQLMPSRIDEVDDVGVTFEQPLATSTNQV